MQYEKKCRRQGQLVCLASKRRTRNTTDAHSQLMTVHSSLMDMLPLYNLLMKDFEPNLPQKEQRKRLDERPETETCNCQ